MSPIMVPINHDPTSLPAVECAALIGKSLGGEYEVLLLNVLASSHEGQMSDQFERAFSLLAPSGVDGRLLRLEGRKTPAIISLCRPDDLIVMQKVAHAGRPPAAIGSTTTEVLRQAPCPVLVVTDQVTPMERPIFAYNGSPQSRRAAATALELLAPGFIRRGTVLTVTSDAHMGARLDSELRELALAQGVELDPPIIRTGKPGQVLEEQIAAGHADLVVMGAYGRRWLRELMFGSTTERMLRGCSVPIWFAN